MRFAAVVALGMVLWLVTMLILPPLFEQLERLAGVLR